MHRCGFIARSILVNLLYVIIILSEGLTCPLGMLMYYVFCTLDHPRTSGAAHGARRGSRTDGRSAARLHPLLQLCDRLVLTLDDFMQVHVDKHASRKMISPTHLVVTGSSAVTTRFMYIYIYVYMYTLYTVYIYIYIHIHINK